MPYLGSYDPKNSVAKRRDALMKAYFESHMAGDPTSMFVKKVKAHKRIHAENVKWMEAKLVKLTLQRFDRVMANIAKKKRVRPSFSA